MNDNLTEVQKVKQTIYSNVNEDNDELSIDEEVISDGLPNEIEASEIADQNSYKDIMYKIDYKILELEIKEEDSKDKVKIKEILNHYINSIKHNVTPETWLTFRDLLCDDPLEIKNPDNKKIYTIGMLRFIMEYSEKYKWLFARDGEKRFIYNGSYWIEISIDLLKEFLILVAYKMKIPEYYSEDTKFIDNIVISLLEKDFFKKMIFPKETLINLQNGTLFITSNGVKLLDSHPCDYLTYQLPFSYDSRRKNKAFLNFLNEVLPDKDTQKTLQQSIASLFIHCLKIEKVPFLYGTGANGKSTIFEVLKGLLDSSLICQYSLESLVDSKGYERSELQGKLINYGSDINMKKINHGIFKQLASGEPIQVRPIYKQPFIMERYAKMIFNINKIDDADIEQTIGFFRRMIFIPFQMRIPPNRQNKNLHNEILQDKAGVLNWIIEGIEEVIIQQDIFISRECELFLDRFIQESNLATRFVNEHEVTNTKETTTFQKMYNKFREFCKNEGEKPLTKISFNRELKKLHFRSTRHSSGMVWHASYR